MIYRPTIVQKLIVSYAIIGASLVVALIYAILSMNSISRTADDIARRDLAATAATIALQENFIEQQRSVGRFLIARQPEYRMLYEQEHEEFERLIALLGKEAETLDLGGLKKAFADFSTLNSRLFDGETLSAADLKPASDRLDKALEVARHGQQHLLEQKLSAAGEIKSRTLS
jgi:hypothetical protein